MATDDISSVTDQLAKTTVDEDDSTEVNFAGKGLKLDRESDAQEIVTAIENCQKLITLRLEGNTLGIDASKAIAKALESHPEFQRALWKDLFTGRLKTEIPQALNFLSSGLVLSKARLVELDLSDNAFGPIGIEGITMLLKSPTCYNLRELRLNNNGLGIGGGKLLAQSLQECFKKSSSEEKPLSLKVFICGRNRLENDGAKALAEFFKSVGSLEEVAMPQNGIYHKGITALADAFSVNKNLRIINLNDNTFTEKGAESMSKILPQLQHLEIINFGDCLVKSKGARLLAEALKNGHKKLKEVYLGFNEIDKDAGLLIGESMENKPDLEKLDLDGNKFGEEGCSALRERLETVGHPNALCSLSDDEGVDDDEDEEDEEEDDEEEEDDDDDDDDDDEEEEDDEYQNSEKDIMKHQSPLKSQTPSHTVLVNKITAKEFLENPSASRLLDMGNNRKSMILEELGTDPTYDKTINVFISIASVITEHDETVKEAACECADAILLQAFNSAEKNDNLSLLSNAILVYLGLIKCEDKKFKPLPDLLGPLILLEHVVRQPYFSKTTKEILQLFLGRPNKAVEKYSHAKHKLMQSLFRF